MRRLLDLETVPGLLALGALAGVLLFPLLWAARLGVAVLQQRRAPATGVTAPGSTPAIQSALDDPRAVPTAAPAASTPAPAAASLGAASDAPLPTLLVPVRGIRASSIPATFGETRGRRPHEGLDIRAARGTAVLAARGGRIVRLSRSSRGGLEVRQLDEGGRLCFYYAHLQRYARGLRPGQGVGEGAVIAYVGSTGNAPERAPHLHFGVFRADASGRCSDEAFDPLPLLAR